MKALLRIIVTLTLLLASHFSANAQYTTCKEIDSFAIRMPRYSTVDLVCGDAPDTSDQSIVFCAPAAFSALIKPDFDHINVAGWHIANGQLYKGFPCKNNTGGLIFLKNGHLRFCNKEDYDMAVRNKVDKIQCAFGQCMVILDGKVQDKFPRGPEWVAYYRVLCEKFGRIFFFETKVPMPRARFMEELAKMKLDNALYMEMGQDYNHTWWRNKNGSVTLQHSFYRGSNWVVFKK